jgi:Fe-S cluster biogenesis protein NfuA
MFIQTQETPNPNSLKFVPGIRLLETGTANILRNDEAAIRHYPIANELFKIQEVENIFIADNFITVTKRNDAKWDYLKPLVLIKLSDFFSSGLHIVAASTQAVNNEEDNELVAQIKEIINEKVRPAVAQDGGDIIFKYFEDGVVYLELHGACSGCPSSTITLKDGIENMLKYYVPEVKAVEAIST